MTRKKYELIEVSSEGTATLLDPETGDVVYLPLPPAESLRRNTPEESAQYAALAEAVQEGKDVVNVVVLSAMGMAAIQSSLT